VDLPSLPAIFRDSVSELTDIRRFASEWEKAASIELRLGNKAAIDDYDAMAHHRRYPGGLLDAIYAAWKNDVDAASRA